MGFELVTNQVELVRAPGAIASALSRSVRLLTVFYALAALGFSTLAPPSPGAGLGRRRRLADAAARPGRRAGSPLGAAAIGILCLLASFTSFNGALLTLSRLVYALAAQGVLPRRLARMDARRMVPPDALAALLAAVVALTFLLSTHALINAVLAGSAAAAGLVWAAAVAVRERPPFAEPGRPRRAPGRRAGAGVAVPRLRPGRARRRLRRTVRPRAWRSPMPIDLSVARWTRDVAVTQWNRDDGALAAIGDALPPAIAGERALGEVHRLDLSLFVVFEEVALRVSGALARSAPSPDALAFAAQQTLDEARHHEMFARRLALSTAAWGTRAGGDDILIPPLRKFIDLCYEVADRGAFVDGLVLTNLVLEGMAYPLYGYEERYWQPVDPYLARLIASAFADETRHVAFGAALVGAALDDDPGGARARPAPHRTTRAA